ncbi:regulator of G-protein signaling loco-like isoform X4 [Leptotrombidium deliense]|uniref:Regulator of G-protein signaling loco-like isoform X4 n=1 Tax=Leptotrombidium deliense TaxID=299467 RepID=A0A443S251_9ACAR|nr:regulator of G-protein signaling loco-like isoform X4 [Leptotrombidium deliense]
MNTSTECSRFNYLSPILECKNEHNRLATNKQRVNSWKESFEILLHDSIGVNAFKIAKEANAIYNKYISVNAENSVNVDSNARRDAEINLKNPKYSMFEIAEKQVYNLMKSDSYRRFLESDVFFEYLELEKHNLHPFGNSKKETDTTFRRDLRKSIGAWQRSKQLKPRLSLPSSSARKIVNQFNRLRSVRKQGSVEEVKFQATPKLKKKDCVKTPTLSDKSRVLGSSEIKKVPEVNQRKSRRLSCVTDLLEATNSDISFSDDTKSDAFFNDLMLMSQKVPIESKSNPVTKERSLMQRSRKSILLQSQVEFFPTACVSKSKIYV